MFLKHYNIVSQQFLGNCCHAKLLTPPRHIANITGRKTEIGGGSTSYPEVGP